MTVSQFRAAYRQGPHAWPGGYPLYAYCTDGGMLCWTCLKAERRRLLEAAADPAYRTGWELEVFDIFWEGREECCHCNRTLESAYQGDDYECFEEQGHE